MSTTPPLGGSGGTVDDWTDDPSFDLSFASTSSSSSTSRSLSRPVGSPLRQMHAALNVKTIDFDDADFDLDDLDDLDVKSGNTIKGKSLSLSRPELNSTPRASKVDAPSTSSMKTIPATVMGTGPAGVGTITKLGSGTGTLMSPASRLPLGAVKARAKAIEQAWEDDVDFDSGVGTSAAADLRSKLHTLTSSSAKHFPGVDALDDLDDDEDQDTLKAGATIKAMLPPKRERDRDAQATIKMSSSMGLSGSGSGSGNGTLRPTSGLAKSLKEEDDLEGDLVLPLSLTNLTLATQSSQPKLRARSSIASTVTTDWDSPSTPSTSGRKTFMFDDSPGGRPSDTSLTSVSSNGLDHSKKSTEDFLEEEEDFESGLILPEQLFQKKGSVLNSILNRKRQQQYVPPPPAQDFEEGLVLEDPRADLSKRRLKESRRARTVPVPFNLCTSKRAEHKELRDPLEVPRPPSKSPASSISRGHNPYRDRSRSRPTSPHVPLSRVSSRSRLSDIPVPSIPPSVPSTPSRLRQQKSYHHLQPSVSPTLVRKKSLASMQDALAAGQLREADLPSISRLTQPTSSSLAKQRNPHRRRMEMPKRRQWGDGSELDSIEDLVDTSAPPAPSYGRLGKRSQEKLPKGVDGGERKKSGKRRPRKPAMLIKNLGSVNERKVVGEMVWNPATLRWEGNEAILRDFDVVASSRPALISHIPTHNSPMKIVGDMKFDPVRMCWISLTEEEDPFASMADDEDEPSTLRISGKKLVSIGLSSIPSATTAQTPQSRFVSESTTISTHSWEGRTRPNAQNAVSTELWNECRAAEERHRREMRGWVTRPGDVRDRERREEKRLWEVRNLAMRS